MKNKKMTRLVLFCASTLLLSVMIFSYFLNTNTVQGASNPLVKSYITVSVNPHDTLWDLAGRYMNTDLYDYDSYIAEVISINNIHEAEIFAGEILTLPVVE
ncbi:MAG: LysM peptidoglycan-binding domain-containing protein [Vallitaleaceae bacterium]|nr:LysM peptidoglycan-binding domain-containing protein [Vallitaleaceae bacterium]